MGAACGLPPRPVLEASSGLPATSEGWLAAARRDAPGMGGVQTARWPAAEGLSACGRTRSFLAPAEGAGRTQLWAET